MATAALRAKSFNESKAPSNYIAGVGRGAAGFTTRSDIGPSEMKAEETQATDGDRGDYSDARFDEFAGFQENLFKGHVWNAADDEADQKYQDVDEHMDGRRKRRREDAEKEQMKQYHKDRPTLSAQLADLKKELGTVSEEEWNNIPDIGDRSIKKKRQEIWTPAPDTLLMAGMDRGHASTLDQRQMQYGGMETPAGMATPQGQATDLRAFARARGSVLDMKLKQVSDSVSGQTVVDPKGFMTALQQQSMSSEGDAFGVLRARQLLNWVTLTNPTNGPGWIARARVEERAGRLAVARQLIADGCEKAPKCEEVWLEAIRLATPQNARVVVAHAVSEIANSVKLWVEAARLEGDDAKKRVVYRKALERVPNSIRLWKEAVELETAENARILLKKAVECVNSVDLWLALAKLGDYDDARAVLNQASKQNMTERRVWIAGAQLEESVDNKPNVERIVRKAVETLSRGGHCSREQWIDEAQKSEAANYPYTCQCIVFSAIGLDLDPDERKHTWTEDAEKCTARKAYRTARAIYSFALQRFPQDVPLWLAAAGLERKQDNHDEVQAILREAVKHCPHSDTLWLMAAKDQWVHGDVQEAREVLVQAFSENPNSEEIWIAAVKLEAENGELLRAAKILETARSRSKTPRIWLKSAKLERQLKNRTKERQLLGEGVKQWPTYEKLWLMLLQWEMWRAMSAKLVTPEETIKQRQALRTLYAHAIKSNPNCVDLWLTASEIEEKLCKDTIRARNVLEKARSKLPNTPNLWVLSARLELRNGRTAMANQQLSQALQKCPASGVLWAEVIKLEPAPSRKAKGVQALKKCERDAQVVTEVAKIFWLERKLESARKMFNRSVALDADYGDAWAYFYKFEVQHGTPEQRAAVESRCKAADPHHGEQWVKVSKAVENVTVGGCRLAVEQLLRQVSLSLEEIDS
ncbi:Protein STABILIZED1 [Diplonema papillatum]|nr:Protein STABILIZED1 [Diplonema papillatum]WGM49978.1 PRP6 [Diplonema papillatum]